MPSFRSQRLLVRGGGKSASTGLDGVTAVETAPLPTSDAGHGVAGGRVGPAVEAQAAERELETAQNPQVVVGDPREYRDAEGVLRRKRGRKPGTKAKPEWRKPGPKTGASRKRPRSSTSSSSGGRVSLAEGGTAAAFRAAAEEFFGGSQLSPDQVQLDNGEDAYAWVVQLTEAKALKEPDADLFLEADTKERLAHLAEKTWTPLHETDNFTWESDEILPSCILFSRKRDGRYKARLVVLGNLQSGVSQSEIFSPTVSLVAQRYFLVEGASRGYYMRQFDITAAFVQASIDDERVFMRLPKRWSEDKKKGDVVRLRKALYGLRASPRKWYDTYKKALLRRGWTECPREPGIFFKRSRDGETDIFLSIYVDDSWIAGGTESEIEEEMNSVLSEFKGKEVVAEVLADGTEVRDVLGAEVKYNREKRSLSISIGKQIDKVLAEYGMTNAKSVTVPCVQEVLEAGKPAPDFPIRELVGSLQWITVTCRPDIAFAVQRLARRQDKDKVTTAVVNAAKRVLRYLKGTRDVGIEYTPEKEAEFSKVFEAVVKKHDSSRGLDDTVVFADSDFAGCSVSLKSTSGIIMYHRGTPILWTSKRQGIRATSTCEAEYVALFDAIKITKSQGFVEGLDEGKELPTIFSDNQSALKVAESTLPTKKSKHMLLRFHEVKDHVRSLCFVPTGINRADPLTKPLTSDKYVGLFHVDPSVESLREEDFDEEDDDDMNGVVRLVYAKY